MWVSWVSVMGWVRASSSFGFAVSSSSSPIHLLLTRATSWPRWCLTPAQPCGSMYYIAQHLQPKMRYQKKLLCSQSCPCWQPFRNSHWRRRRAEQARGAHAAKWGRLFSDQWDSLHVKAVVRMKMKLFCEASHLWLPFQSKPRWIQCICARVGNSHGFGREKMFPL